MNKSLAIAVTFLLACSLVSCTNTEQQALESRVAELEEMLGMGESVSVSESTPPIQISPEEEERILAVIKEEVQTAFGDFAEIESVYVHRAGDGSEYDADSLIVVMAEESDIVWIFHGEDVQQEYLLAVQAVADRYGEQLALSKVGYGWEQETEEFTNEGYHVYIVGSVGFNLNTRFLQ